MSINTDNLTISYAKLRSGDWGVRIQADNTEDLIDIGEGDTVDVTTKAGAVKTEVLDRCVWSDEQTALYTIVPRSLLHAAPIAPKAATKRATPPAPQPVAQPTVSEALGAAIAAQEQASLAVLDAANAWERNASVGAADLRDAVRAWRAASEAMLASHHTQNERAAIAAQDVVTDVETTIDF